MLRRLILAILVCPIMLMSACISSSDNNGSGEKVITSVLSDAAGNAFVAYRLERSVGDHDICLQKIGSEGNTLWDKQLFIGDDRRASVLGMVTDGNGGVFIAWEVLTPENGKEGPHHFDRNILMRVDGQGEIKLNQDFYVRGMKMVSDGVGGIILGWATEEDHRVLREDGNGSTLWAHPVSSRGTGLKLAAGENGESFILWRYLDNPYFVVQKLSADGQVLWGEEGMPEGVRIKHLDTALPPEPQIVGDATGGAIVSWAEALGGGMPSYVWLCRIGDEGQVLMTNPVRELASTVNSQVSLVSDGQLGAIVVWEDHRDGMALYTQRPYTNPLSSYIPPENGVSVCTGLPEVSPRFDAIFDGKGGVIVAWIDGNRKLCVQKLDSVGQRQWGDEGILIADGVCDLPVMITKVKQNGFAIGWCTGKDKHIPEDSFIQRIDLEGNLLWGSEGIKLN